MSSVARRLVAQIADKDPKGVITYRAEPAQKLALADVIREESRRKRRSQSAVVEFLVGLGTDLYWVRHELGGAMDALAAERGWDRRRALMELVRRGLSALKK